MPVAQAYSDVGMRAVIAPMMADTTFYRAIPGLIEAMPAGLREKAEALRPPGNDDTILRWNACVRILIDHPSLGPAPEDRVEHPLE